jgi:hypothetical protein
MPEPLGALWAKLKTISRLDFTATSRSPENSGWNGSGVGTVCVSTSDERTIHFSERGQWRPSDNATGVAPAITFTNTFRWTWQDSRIRLEHLRFGPDQPVYLFDIVALSATEFHSVEPHVCREDRYAASVRLDRKKICVGWIVTGPTKDESIEYIYQPD